jgi:hypothetical protein
MRLVWFRDRAIGPLRSLNFHKLSTSQDKKKATVGITVAVDLYKFNQ